MAVLPKRLRDYFSNTFRWNEAEPKYGLVDDLRELTSCLVWMSWSTQHSAGSSWKEGTSDDHIIPRGAWFQPLFGRVYCSTNDKASKIGIKADDGTHHTFAVDTSSRDVEFLKGVNMADCLLEEGLELSVFFTDGPDTDHATVNLWGKMIPNGKKKNPSDHYFKNLEW